MGSAMMACHDRSLCRGSVMQAHGSAMETSNMVHSVQSLQKSMHADEQMGMLDKKQGICVPCSYRGGGVAGGRGGDASDRGLLKRCGRMVGSRQSRICMDQNTCKGVNKRLPLISFFLSQSE